MTYLQRRRTRPLRKLLYAIVVLTTFLTLLEFTVRVSGIHTRRESPFFLLVRVHEYPEYFRRHPKLFWEMVPNVRIDTGFLVSGVYQINSHGFRGTEFLSAKPTDTYRICCIGNSCTFGWGVGEEWSYPRQLERILNTEHKLGNIEVINCGVPGYTSHQGLQLMKEELLTLEPDLVTVCYGWNDHWAAVFEIEDKNQHVPSAVIVWLQNALSKSHFYLMLKYSILGLTESDDLECKYDRSNLKYRVSLLDYMSNIERIALMCAERGIETLFLTAPIADIEAFLGPGKTSHVHLIHAAYEDSMKAAVERNSLHLCDVTELFNGRTDLFDKGLDDFIHYNASGHRLIAEQVAHCLTDLELVFVAER